MTDKTKRCPVKFLALTTHEGRLYGVGKAGNLLPLSVFGPLAEAYAADPPYRVGFAPEWPRYARNFVLKYLPFPELSADQVPDDLEPKITTQERPDDQKRPWKQTLYNGWPLYFVQDGWLPQSAGTHLVMFVPATVDLPTPQDMEVSFSPDAIELMAQDAEEDGGGVRIPGPYIGP